MQRTQHTRWQAPAEFWRAAISARGLRPTTLRVYAYLVERGVEVSSSIPGEAPELVLEDRNHVIGAAIGVGPAAVVTAMRELGSLGLVRSIGSGPSRARIAPGASL